MYKIVGTWSTLIMLFIIGCTPGEKSGVEDKSSRKAKVVLRKVNTSHHQKKLKYSGTIEAEKTAQLGFSVPGTIANVLVEEGDKVSSGQLLATVNTIEYENALAIAQAGFEEAKDAYTRLEGLYKKGSLPERDFISAKSGFAQAQAQLNLAQKRLADTQLKASISGIVAMKNTELGANANPGMPVFTIVKTDKVNNIVSIPESEIGAVKIGDSSTVFIPTLNRGFSGAISTISPVADPVSRTYKVKVRLENMDYAIMPGMLSKVEINTQQSTNEIIVPAKAVVRDSDNKTNLFVYDAKGYVKKRPITVGLISAEGVVVKRGVQTGDHVVIEGQSRLKDGDEVEVVKSEKELLSWRSTK